MKKISILSSIFIFFLILISCNNTNDFLVYTSNIRFSLNRSSITTETLAPVSQPITASIYEYSSATSSTLLQTSSADLSSDSASFVFINIPVNTKIVIEVEATITFKDGQVSTYKGSSATAIAPYYTVSAGNNIIPISISKESSGNHSITYHLNGLSFMDGYSPATSFKSAETVTLPTITDLTFSDTTSTDYGFLGWFLNEGFFGNPVTSLSGDSYGDNVDLYARFGIILSDSSLVKESITTQSATPNQRFLISCTVDYATYSSLLVCPSGTLHLDLKNMKCISDTTAETITSTEPIVEGYSTASTANKTYLQSIYLPDSTTEISQGTFQDSTSLSFVAIPSSVKVINENAFSNCSPSLKFCFEWTNGWYYIDNSDGTFSPDAGYTNGTYVADITTLLKDDTKVYIFYHD